VNIKRILTFFQYFYFFSAILLLIAFLYAGAQDSWRLDVLLPDIIASIIAYGIFIRRHWVPLLVTLFASWGILSNIFSPESLGASIFSITVLCFEIYFFNRKDVKRILITTTRR
jgi:hypothetical protein